MGSKAGQQSETPQERASAEHAVAQLKDYRQRWLPVQQRLAETIEASGEKDSAARRLATGKATTDTAMAFDKAGGALERSLANKGVGPGSSRSNLAVAGIGSDAATSSGLGAVMSDQAIDDAYTQGLGALTSLGRGERASVGSSLSRMAEASSAQARADANASLMARESDAGMAGTVAGFGVQQGLKKLGSGVNGFDTTSSTQMMYGNGGNLGTPQAGV